MDLESSLIKMLNLLDDLKTVKDKGDLNNLTMAFDISKEYLIKILQRVEV